VSPETFQFRQRALRLLDTTLEASERTSEFEAIRSVAAKVGVAEESVRRWHRKRQIDAGQLAGTSSSEHAEIRRLKRELAESRRAIEVLKAASAFFAAELRLCQRHLSRWQHHEKKRGTGGPGGVAERAAAPARLRVLSGGSLYEPRRFATWLMPLA
jgi:transposase